MNSTSRMYKTLSSEEVAKLGIVLSRKYYYVSENDIKDIKEEPLINTPTNKQYQIIDDSYEWNPKNSSLFLNLELSIKNASCIFGKNGSCYNDSIIGIGLSWKPDKSRIKRCIKIGEISSNDINKTFAINDIELQNISSNTSFKLFLYVVNPGKNGGNPYFGNDKGIIIYENVEWTIVVSGNSSIFPIRLDEDENGPLWYYTCDFVDICEDMFDDEHICIFLNPRHPSYPFINPDSPEFQPSFYNEVFSSAITCIILSIREQEPNDKIDFDKDYENQSIMQVLNYFHEKLNFNINGTYDKLVSSIKLFFDKG